MNWGNKLLTVFLVFGTGMGYLVYRSVNTRFELVEKDYYKSELRYQQVIDATSRAAALSQPVKLEQTETGIALQLPPEMAEKNIRGDVWFYCAYDERKDKKFALNPGNGGRQVFAPGVVPPGDYTVKISWADNGNSYFSENRITVL